MDLHRGFNIFSRRGSCGGSVQVFLRKPLARCDFPVGGGGLDLLSPIWSMLLGFFFTCIFTSCADPKILSEGVQLSFLGHEGIKDSIILSL